MSGQFKRAFCTFCETSRAITKSGKPVGHTKSSRYGRGGCPGLLKAAQDCDDCHGDGKLHTMYGTVIEGASCNLCKGDGLVIR